MRHPIALLVGIVAFAPAPVAPLAAAQANGSVGCAQQQSAVVGGKHVQPTPDELASLAARGDCAVPSVDTSRGDADEVDQLYRQLMDQTAHDGAAVEGQPHR